MWKNNKFTKIMAFLALFWIIIWIIGTWIVIIFSNGNNQSQNLTSEEYAEIQELINSQSGSINEENIETQTWMIETSTWETETMTWEIQ